MGNSEKDRSAQSGRPSETEGDSHKEAPYTPWERMSKVENRSKDAGRKLKTY